MLNYSCAMRKKIWHAEIERKLCQEMSVLPFAVLANVKLKLPIVVSPYYFRLNDMWMLDLTSLDFTLWQEVRAWLSILYIAKLTLFILDIVLSVLNCSS
jgi:hypothetical protein